MSKDPYRIVDSKPSWFSKLGSGAVALGSVATAIVITVPGFPGYQFLSQAEVAFNGVSAPAGDQSSDPSISAEGLSQNLTNSFSSQTGASATSTVSLGGSLPSPSSQVSNNAAALASQPSTSLKLPSVNSGNTSSPTPYSSGQTGANTPAGGNTAAGNTSSPTPGGSESEYEEDEDEDEYEDEDEGEDDD